MQRILIGCGTALGNHLSALGGFDLHLSYRAAIAAMPACVEAVVIAPAGRRMAGGTLGSGGSKLAAAIRGHAKRLILLSSLDVYPIRSLPFDEHSGICETGPRASWTRQGALVFAFEREMRDAAQTVSILRLPEVFGPGFTHGACRQLTDDLAPQINRVAICQWYPARRLEQDIIVARHLRAPVVNLCPEPVSMAKVLKIAFPGETGHVHSPARYSRIATRFAEAFGGTGGYIMSAPDVLSDLCQHIAICRKLIRPARMTAGRIPPPALTQAAVAHPI